MPAMTLELAPGLQRLIDERLDAVERSLLHSGVPRGERQTAVAEVNSQIQEMLVERAPAGVDRQDVLAVLARLDPPEAYLAEETLAPMGRELPRGLAGHVAPVAVPGAAPAPVAAAGPSGTPPARINILAVCSAGAAAVGTLAGLGVIAGYAGESELVMLLCGIVALLMGILATIGGVISLFKIREARGREIGLSAGVFATLFLPLAVIDLAQLFFMLLFSEIGIFLSLGFNILLTNVVLIFAAWKFLAGRLARTRLA